MPFSACLLLIFSPFLSCAGAIVELDNGDVAHEEVATEGDVMVMSGSNNSAVDEEAEEEDEDAGLVIGDSFNGSQRGNQVS